MSDLSGWGGVGWGSLEFSRKKKPQKYLTSKYYAMLELANASN